MILKFVKKVAKQGDRLLITIPKPIRDFVDPEQRYEIVLKPRGKEGE